MVQVVEYLLASLRPCAQLLYPPKTLVSFSTPLFKTSLVFPLSKLPKLQIGVFPQNSVYAVRMAFIYYILFGDLSSSRLYAH
jgi:hypothetical protein